MELDSIRLHEIRASNFEYPAQCYEESELLVSSQLGTMCSSNPISNNSSQLGIPVKI